jgi:hypothetical protein
MSQLILERVVIIISIKGVYIRRISARNAMETFPDLLLLRDELETEITKISRA